MAVSKRLRYEVLRRDNHACRYCGATAPEAKLTVDHVTPVVLGGTDEPSNLVTACVDCNAGKTSSAPDADLVTDVSATALRWADAMREAADIALAEMDHRAELADRFRDHWEDWTYGFKRENFPLPGGWQASVNAILSAGLPEEILRECIDLAMANTSHVAIDDVFRYMCGIAWKRVNKLREIAEALLSVEDAHADDGESG